MPNSDPVVFLVDDDEGARNSLEMLLETYDLEVTSCESAKQFLEIVENQGCACLVLDIHMEGMDGFELLEVLKDHQTSFPVVMITGAMDTGIPEKAKKAGVLEVLEKPLDVDELVSAIRRAVNK